MAVEASSLLQRGEVLKRGHIVLGRDLGAGADGEQKFLKNEIEIAIQECHQGK